jgi:uncharacterized protein
MSRILIVSGGGRYADPWHPFAATSGRVQAALLDSGHDVNVADDPDGALAALAASPGSGPELPDLLILNVGNPKDASPAPEAGAGLLAYLRDGRPLLALHSSSTTFATWEEWEAILGGRWVRGTSMHPEQGDARIKVLASGHPVTAGLGDFEVNDERYSYLRTGADIDVLAVHEHDGVEHPILWSHRYGTADVVYDALGHDEKSYAAPARLQLLQNSVAWLLRED